MNVGTEKKKRIPVFFTRRIYIVSVLCAVPRYEKRFIKFFTMEKLFVDKTERVVRRRLVTIIFQRNSVLG